MRILFTIVAFLGLLVAGVSAFEIRATREHGLRVSELQRITLNLHIKQVAAEKAAEEKEHINRSIMQSGPTFEQEVASCGNGVESLEGGWMAVGSVGVVLLFVGIRGLVMARKITKFSDTAM